MEEIKNFKNFNLNNYIGNYKDIINNKNVFIIPKKNDNNILYLFNLYNKYFLELNLLLKKCSYFSIPFFNDKYDIRKLIDISNNTLIRKIGSEWNFQFLVKNQYMELTVFNLFHKNIKYIKIYQNIDLEQLIINNKNIKITKGGTRSVFLLDKIVIKEIDPYCDVNCEIITNYFIKSNNINVSEIMGLLKNNDKLCLCEKRYKFIDWTKVYENPLYILYFKIKWKQLIKFIGKNISGDYNLGNVLLDFSNNLIITDMNGNHSNIILNSGLISSIDNANKFSTRLSDYIFDNRISPTKYHIKKKIKNSLNKIICYNYNPVFLEKMFNNIKNIFIGSIDSILIQVIMNYNTINEIINQVSFELLSPIIWKALSINNYKFNNEWFTNYSDVEQIIINEKADIIASIDGWANYALTVLNGSYDKLEEHMINSISETKKNSSLLNDFKLLSNNYKYKYLKYKQKYISLKKTKK